jgi:hypothetical protein
MSSTNENQEPKNENPNLDPTHKLNQPVEFDPSVFGDLSDVSVPKSFTEAVTKPTPKKDEPMDSPEIEALLAKPPALPVGGEKTIAQRSEALRNMVTQTLKGGWPEAYAQYRAIKYPVPGVEPSLEQRKRAYTFAFRAFLALTYRQSFTDEKSNG